MELTIGDQCKVVLQLDSAGTVGVGEALGVVSKPPPPPHYTYTGQSMHAGTCSIRTKLCKDDFTLGLLILALSQCSDASSGEIWNKNSGYAPNLA
jgi:hypothetical protein